MSTQVTLVGNVGGTPERRTTSKGDSYARFRVASNERRLEADGTWVDGSTSWYDVQAYGALGENVLASVTSGQRVLVQGDLTINDWTASDGSRHTNARVRAGAVGHDLLFGTTQFRRPERRSAQPAQPARLEQATPEAQDSSPSASVDHSDEWAPVLVPGSVAPSEGALVGAGFADETPF